MKPGPKPTWKVVNRGRVPALAPNHAMYTCLGCMHEASLPVVGVAIAQIGQGLIFDPGDHAAPRTVQCRKCRRNYELEG